jgi:hypothetical protein
MSNSVLHDLFHNRTAALATMHQKEQVMAPILQSSLGVQIIVPAALNTDDFGTFTRDVKRPGDQLSTARLKAAQAMGLTGLTLAFASEGSFGPHPLIPFQACDRELVILSDRTHGLEIVGQALSTETNYSHQRITTVEAALSFAKKIGFPTHGLVAMADAQPISSLNRGRATGATQQQTADCPIVKGITDTAQLVETVTWLLKKFGQAYLETDMRAMHNPTRMNVIAQATRDLVDRVRQSCPECGYPGFAPIQRQAGLPCALCGLPTDLTLAVIHSCQHCKFSRTVYFPDQREVAE